MTTNPSKNVMRIDEPDAISLDADADIVSVVPLNPIVTTPFELVDCLDELEEVLLLLVDIDVADEELRDEEIVLLFCTGLQITIEEQNT